jgi:hypothetical protein
MLNPFPRQPAHLAFTTRLQIVGMPFLRPLVCLDLQREREGPYRRSAEPKMVEVAK